MMITKNYKNLLMAAPFYFYSTYMTINTSTKHLCLVDTGGSARYLPTALEATFYRLGSKNGASSDCLQKTYSNGGSVVIGSGSSAETEDSYKLDSLLTGGFSYTATQTCKHDDDGAAVLQYTFTITATAAITIGEIGYVTSINTGDGSYYNFLIDRTVLASPIKLASGEICKITYQIVNNTPKQLLTSSASSS